MTVTKPRLFTAEADRPAAPPAVVALPAIEAAAVN